MRLHTLLCLALLPVAVFANTITEDDRQFFINTYADIAVSEMNRSKVPASITLAQAILESRWGRGSVAVEANNFFCIKCYNGWSGPTFDAKDDEPGLSCFRKYQNVEESFMDHSDFLKNNVRYGVLFEFDPTDYKSWAEGLGKCGYATDPQYGEKLINLIEAYGLWMYDYAMPVAHFEILTAPQMEISDEAAEEVAITLNQSDGFRAEAGAVTIPVPVYEIEKPLATLTSAEVVMNTGAAPGLNMATGRKNKIRPILPVLSYQPERW